MPVGRGGTHQLSGRAAVIRAPDTGIPLEALFVNPVRPIRVEPRVKKRRPKTFPFMIKLRYILRQALR
jgi:hypothetical protein